MKPPSKNVKQLFDEMADFVSPENRVSFERLGRRLSLLNPDDEILILVWYVALHSDIVVNERRLLVARVEESNRIVKADIVARFDAHSQALAKQYEDLEKWRKLLFCLLLGQSVLLLAFMAHMAWLLNIQVTH